MQSSYISKALLVIIIQVFLRVGSLLIEQASNEQVREVILHHKMTVELH